MLGAGVTQDFPSWALLYRPCGAEVAATGGLCLR